MGVHHAWGRTYKDLWQRFNTMRGYRQRYQNGFDCQGLWVEVEVEKELGFTNKRQIEELWHRPLRGRSAKSACCASRRVTGGAVDPPGRVDALGRLVLHDVG